MSSLQQALSLFDGAFCINLDSREDRWEAQKEQFIKHNIQDMVERFSAIDLRKTFKNTKYDVKDRLNYSKLGHAGCLLSHLEIIKEAKERDWKNVVVFEDDATFIQDSLSAAEDSVVDLMERDWEVFYFGATYRSPMTRVTRNLLRVNGGAYATHAICYNNQVYDKIISTAPGDPEELLSINSIGSDVVAVDVYLVRVLSPAFSFASDPIVAVQRDNFSNISECEQPGMMKMQLDFFNKWRPK